MKYLKQQVTFYCDDCRRVYSRESSQDRLIDQTMPAAWVERKLLVPAAPYTGSREFEKWQHYCPDCAVKYGYITVTPIVRESNGEEASNS